MTNLEKRIIGCERCPRLVNYRQEVARTKRKEFRDCIYWGKPVPGFGPLGAKLVIIGLAPAAHGGNRTGRVFTGDPSAQFLMQRLYTAGFANQPFSLSREDGLELVDAYITAAVRCVPPDNKPTAREIQNCSGFLEEELHLLTQVKVVLALGRLAFEAYRRFLSSENVVETGRLRFRHGASYRVKGNYPTLYVSYHPSPRNTNTGTLTSQMFAEVLRRIRNEIYSSKGHRGQKKKTDISM